MATRRAPGPGIAGRVSAAVPGSWPRGQVRQRIPNPSFRAPPAADGPKPADHRPIRPRAPHGTSVLDKPYPGCPEQKRSPWVCADPIGSVVIPLPAACSQHFRLHLGGSSGKLARSQAFKEWERRFYGYPHTPMFMRLDFSLCSSGWPRAGLVYQTGLSLSAWRASSHRAFYVLKISFHARVLLFERVENGTT